MKLENKYQKDITYMFSLSKLTWELHIRHILIVKVLWCQHAVFEKKTSSIREFVGNHGLKYWSETNTNLGLDCYPPNKGISALRQRTFN